MKILHVVPIFAPCFEAGGVVNASYQIAKKQAENGHDVTIITTDNCKERIPLKKDNIDGIKVNYFKNISNSFKNKFTIDTPIGLNNYLKDIKDFDIIHIHEHRHTLAILTHHHAKLNNIPYIIQAHGSVLPFFQKEKLKEIFDKIWGFNILADASKLFALTETEKEQYLKMKVKEENIEIVPLGVDLKEYSNLPEKGKFRLKFNISNRDILLIFVGRINEIKGLDLLVKSFKNLIKLNQDTKLKLAIVGSDNGYLNTLKKLINELNLNDEIILTGPLFKEDKLEGLVDSDIFVMSSKYESFTTSGLEAMACGKPLVLTKNNHIHNWVNETTGLSCEDNIEDLSKTINKLVNNENLRNIYGHNGKKLIATKYNWDIIYEEIINIYKKVIEGNELMKKRADN